MTFSALNLDYRKSPYDYTDIQFFGNSDLFGPGNKFKKHDVTANKYAEYRKVNCKKKVREQIKTARRLALSNRGFK